MSAECNDCGRDIEYPVGSWPIGECSYCRLSAELDVLKADMEWIAENAPHSAIMDTPLVEPFPPPPHDGCTACFAASSLQRAAAVLRPPTAGKGET